MSVSSSSVTKILPLNIVVFIGSTRTARLSDPLLKLVSKTLSSRGHTVTLFDAKVESFPLLQKPFHHYGAYGDKTPVPDYLLKWQPILKNADGYFILDCEYNHTPSPGLINLLDHFWHETYAHKVAAIGTYSYSGTAGVRSAFVLRNTLAELGMITTPKVFAGPAIVELVTEKGEFKDPIKQTLLNNVVNELEWYINALKTQKIGGTPVVQA